MDTVVDVELLTDGFLPRPVRLGEALADHDGLLGGVARGVGENGAANQRNADRLEVAAADNGEIGFRQAIGGDILAANLKWHLKRLVAIEWNVAGEGNGQDAKLRREPGKQPIHEVENERRLICLNGGICITSPIEIDTRRDDVRRDEAALEIGRASCRERGEREVGV